MLVKEASADQMTFKMVAYNSRSLRAFQVSEAPGAFQHEDAFLSE